MSSFAPPIYNSDIFASGLFNTGEDLLSLETADERYLKLSGGTVRGFTTFIGGINTTSLSINGSALDLSVITGITAGQALANKALVLNGSRNISNINQIETTGRFFMRTTGFGFTQEHGPNDADGEIITKVGATFGEIGSFRSTDIGLITNNLRRITVKHTTGFVGIGTSAPVRMLEVSGGCLISGEVLFSNATASTSPTTGALRVSGGVGVSGQLSSNTVSTTGLINTSILNDTTSFTTYQSWTNPLTTSMSSVLRMSNVGAAIGTTTNHPFRLISNDTIRLTVLANGNIGIGTTTPTTLLDVNGALNVSGVITATSSSANTYSFSAPGDMSFNVVGVGSNPFPTLNLIRQSTASGSALFAGDTLTDWRLQANENGMFIQSGVGTITSTRMVILNNGNVGINRTTATSTLDIDGDIAATGRININRTDFGLAHAHAGGSSDPEVVTRVNATHAQVGCFRNTDFQLITNGLARMTVLKDGNIGIGRADPTNLLDVNGTCRISGLTQIANSTPSTASTNGALLIAGGVGIGGQLHMVNNIVITAGGFNGFIHRAGTAPTDAITITEPGGIGTNNSTNFHLFTNGNRRLTVLADGKVGINTQTPTELLHVNGKILCNNLDVSGPNMTIFSGADTNFTIRSTVSSTSYYPTIDFVRGPSYGSDNVVDWRMRCFGQDFVYYAADNTVGNTEIMRLTSLGNVGIGISSPTCPLDVGGVRSVQTSALISVNTYSYNVSNNGWSNLGGGPLSVNMCARFRDSIWVQDKIYATSDRRLKENIVPLDFSLDHFMKLNPVSYNFKNNEDTKLGVIAQEMLPICRESITFMPNENMKKEEDDDLDGVQLCVDYNSINMMNTVAIKKIITKVKILEETLEKLLSKPAIAKWMAKESSEK